MISKNDKLESGRMICIERQEYQSIIKRTKKQFCLQCLEMTESLSRDDKLKRVGYNFRN